MNRLVLLGILFGGIQFSPDGQVASANRYLALKNASGKVQIDSAS